MTISSFQNIEPISYEAAVRLALARFERDEVETMWSGALSSGIRDAGVIETLDETEGMIQERRQLRVQAPPEAAFRAIRSLGGATGWLYADWLWKIRGFVDLLVGYWYVFYLPHRFPGMLRALGRRAEALAADAPVETISA